VLGAAALMIATTVSTLALVQARRDRQRALDGQAAAEAANTIAERESENLRKTISFFSKGILFQSYGNQQGRAISVIDALRRADARISRELSADPLTEARLRYSIGLVSLADLDMASAEVQLRRAAELIAKLDRKYADEDRLIRLHLARAVRELGRFEEAEAINRQIVEDAGVAGDEWIRTNAMGELALTIAAAGRTAEADRLLRESSTLVQSVEALEPRNWIGPFMRHLRLLVQTGRGEQVPSILQEQLQFIDRAASATPAQRRVAKAELIASIGEELVASGSPSGSRYLEESYAVWSQTEEEPLARARSALALADTLIAFAPAKPDASLSLRLQELAHDADAQLGQLPTDQATREVGDRLRAEAMATRAWSCILAEKPGQAVELLGPDRTTVDQILTPLPDPTRSARARALSMLGDHEQAALLARREYEASLRQHGLAAAQTGWSLGALISVLDSAGRQRDADASISELVGRLQTSPNQHTHDYAMAQINLAQLLHERRRGSMAADILDKLIAILSPSNLNRTSPDQEGYATPLLQQVVRTRAQIPSGDRARDQRFASEWTQVLQPSAN